MQLHSLFNDKRRMELRDAIGKNELAKVLRRKEPGLDGELRPGTGENSELWYSSAVQNPLIEIIGYVDKNVFNSQEPTGKRRANAHECLQVARDLLKRAKECLIRDFGKEKCHFSEREVLDKLARQGSGKQVSFDNLERRILELIKLRNFMKDVIVPLARDLDDKVDMEERFAQASKQGPK